LHQEITRAFDLHTLSSDLLTGVFGVETGSATGTAVPGDGVTSWQSPLPSQDGEPTAATQPVERVMPELPRHLQQLPDRKHLSRRKRVAPHLTPIDAARCRCCAFVLRL
jgi:hypothetical protein